jgi:hypothetical protein
VAYNSPMINGQKPNEEFELDDKAHLKALGLDPNDRDEKADKYVHYPHCDWAVIEWKGSAIPKAIRQIELTTERLAKINKPVNLVMIIKKRINRYEQRFYRRRRDRVLIDPQTQDPYTVAVGNHSLNVLLLYYSEKHSDVKMDIYLAGGGK